MKPIPFALPLLLALTAHAEDWPRFLGPRQDNTVTEAKLNLDWGEFGPPALWKAEVGNAYSPPVVAGGKVYVFHRLGQEEILEARKVTDGTPVWRRGYATRYEDQYGYNNGPRASPFVDGAMVYSFGAEGTLTAFATSDGTQAWQRRLNAELNAEPNFFGTGPSPVVEGGTVIVSVGGTHKGVVLGIDKLTGKTAWTATEDGQSYSTPVVADIAGQRTAVVVTRNRILALDPATGALRFSAPFQSRTYESVNAASPVVSGDEVFCSSTYGVGSILLRAKPAGDWETVWRDESSMENHWATSLKIGDALYGMHGRHESGSSFRCIDWKTGKVRWEAPKGLGRATFVYHQGHFIAVGERGDLALIEVSPDGYKEKRKVRVLDYPCWTPPVISDGRLFLRNEKTLVCFDLRKP